MGLVARNKTLMARQRVRAFASRTTSAKNAIGRGRILPLNIVPDSNRAVARMTVARMTLGSGVRLVSGARKSLGCESNNAAMFVCRICFERDDGQCRNARSIDARHQSQDRYWLGRLPSPRPGLPLQGDLYACAFRQSAVISFFSLYVALAGLKRAGRFGFDSPALFAIVLAGSIESEGSGSITGDMSPARDRWMSAQLGHGAGALVAIQDQKGLYARGLGR